MGFLRLFLAIAVVATHAGKIFGIPMVSGRTAVECFFVISGFYMCMVLEQKYLRLPTRQWLTFIGSRVLRLFPVYLVVLLASALLVLLGGEIWGAQIGQLFNLPVITWIPLVLSNLALVTQDWSLFFALSPDGHLYFTPDFWSQATPAYVYYLVPPAWTVGIELVFYMLAPFIARRGNRLILGILLASLALRIVLAIAGYSDDPWSYRFFPTELAYFMAGMLVFRMRGRLVSLWARGPRFLPLGLVFAALVVLPIFRILPLLDSVVAVIFPFAFALFVPAVFASTSRLRVDRWIGELSYPLYLVHFFVLSVLVSLSVVVPSFVAVLLSLVAAAILVIAVDRPIEVYRQKRITAQLNRAGIAYSADEGGVTPMKSTETVTPA